LCSEYYAVFFLAACIGTLAALVSAVPEIRRAALNFCRREPYAVALAIGLPISMAGWLYFNHVKHLPRAENSVMQFYWSKGTSMLRFISDNWRNDLNFLSPIELGSGVAMCLLGILLMAVVWRFLVRPATAGQNSASFS